MSSRILPRLAALLVIPLLILPCFAATGLGASMTEPASAAAYMVELNTGTVVYSMNAEAKLYPASTTKMMSAIVALETIAADPLKSLEDVITFSRNAVYSIPWDTMNIGIQVGEELTVRQVLYAMMLPSANEACMGMAEYIAGSVDAFVEMMNKKAEELGLINTHYKNPHGLHHEDHYTCAADLAKIITHAITIDTLRDVMMTQSYTIPETNKTAKRVLTSTNKLILPSNNYYDERVLCGKTGFTTPAGNTLATYSEVNGMKLVCIIMKAGQGVTFPSTSNMLDWCETNLELVTMTDIFDYARSITTQDGGIVYAQPETELTLLVPRSVGLSGCEIVYDLPASVVAPVEKNQYLGNISFYHNDMLLGSCRLVSRASYNIVTTYAPQTTLPTTPSSVTTPDDIEDPKQEERTGLVKTFVVALAAVMLLCGIVYAMVFCGSLYIYSKKHRTRKDLDVPEFMSDGKERTRKKNARRKK